MTISPSTPATNIVFRNQEAVWSALNDFVAAKPVKTAKGMKAADLPDALIVNKTQAIAHDINQPYAAPYSFDLAALKWMGRNHCSSEIAVRGCAESVRRELRIPRQWH